MSRKNRFYLLNKENSEIEKEAEHLANSVDTFGSTMSQVNTYQDALNKILDGKHSPVEDVDYLKNNLLGKKHTVDKLNSSLEENKKYTSDILRRLGISTSGSDHLISENEEGKK